MAGTLTIGTLSDGTNSTSSTNAIKGSAKAWVNFNAYSGATSIRASYNVSSVTYNSTGDFTINFTSALADANYAFAGSTGRPDNAAGPLIVSRHYGNGSDYSSWMTASLCRITCNNVANTVVNPDYVGVAFFR